MEAQIKLGRVFGVEIGPRFSWLIIAPLIMLSLSRYFHAANLDWGRGNIWALAIVTAALFFAAVIAHELSHAVVARSRGLPVIFDHALRARRCGENRGRSRRREDRILDGGRRPNHERCHRADLSGPDVGARMGASKDPASAGWGDVLVARIYQQMSNHAAGSAALTSLPATAARQC